MINNIVSLFQFSGISLKISFNEDLIHIGIQALMAEWLRRVIRNHLGSSRAGSNPVQCDHFLIIFQYKLTDFLSKVLTGHSGVIIYLNKKFN